MYNIFRIFKISVKIVSVNNLAEPIWNHCEIMQNKIIKTKYLQMTDFIQALEICKFTIKKIRFQDINAMLGSTLKKYSVCIYFIDSRITTIIQ